MKLRVSSLCCPLWRCYSARRSVEYWIHFQARSDGVHAFGYTVTPPKVDRFGWNLEHSEYIVPGWPWQILGAIRAVPRAGQPGEILCFLSGSRRLNFTKFDHSTSIGVAMNPFGFWNVPVRGRFPKKCKKWFSQRLATSGRHNSAMITDRRKFITKWPIYGMSIFPFLPLESIQGHSYGLYALRTRNLTSF